MTYNLLSSITDISMTCMSMTYSMSMYVYDVFHVHVVDIPHYIFHIHFVFHMPRIHEYIFHLLVT